MEAIKRGILGPFPDPEPKHFVPLRTLDIFAGAGGLSKGIFSLKILKPEICGSITKHLIFFYIFVFRT